MDLDSDSDSGSDSSNNAPKVVFRQRKTPKVTAGRTRVQEVEVLEPEQPTAVRPTKAKFASTKTVFDTTTIASKSDSPSLKDTLKRYTVIPDPSLVQELKDRRNRETARELQEARDRDIIEDYDPEFDRLTRQDPADHSDMEVDDGRLALSANEKTAQDLLKRKEIEEALSDISMGSDSEDSLHEVYESVVPRHFLGKEAKESALDDIRKPRLRKVPPREETLAFAKGRLAALHNLRDKDNVRMAQIDSQLQALHRERDELRQALDDAV